MQKDDILHPFCLNLTLCSMLSETFSHARSGTSTTEQMLPIIKQLLTSLHKERMNFAECNWPKLEVCQLPGLIIASLMKKPSMRVLMTRGGLGFGFILRILCWCLTDSTLSSVVILWLSEALVGDWTHLTYRPMWKVIAAAPLLNMESPCTKDIFIPLSARGCHSFQTLLRRLRFLKYQNCI